MKIAIAVFAIFVNLFSQSLSEINNFKLSSIEILNGLSPEKIRMAPSGYLFFDFYNAKIVLFSKNEQLFYGGRSSNGKGLIDPIDAAINGLDIFVLNQSSSSILRFDTKLNYLESINIDAEEDLFSNLIAVDDFSKIYIYSKENNKIYFSNNLNNKFSIFIDFSLFGLDFDCIEDMSIDMQNNLILLIDCLREFFVFNRSGKLISRFPINIDEPIIILSLGSEYLVANNKSEIEIGFPDNKIIKIDNEIRDIVYSNNKLSILSDSLLTIYVYNKK